jgi:tellurite resistance protein TehA-like permease
LTAGPRVLRLRTAVAAIASLVLGTLALARVARVRHAASEDLTDPVQSPFAALPPIVVMLLGALGLAPHDKGAAGVVVAVGLVTSPVVGGWLPGVWLAGPIDDRRAHPGYFIPALGSPRSGCCRSTGRSRSSRTCGASRFRGRPSPDWRS